MASEGNGTISTTNSGRACPGDELADTSRGNALEARGRVTGGTAATLEDRGQSPEQDSLLSDEVIGARLKRQTIDPPGALASTRCTTIGGVNPVGAEVEDVPFPPLPPGISPEAPLASDGHAGTDRCLSRGVNTPGQSPVRRREARKGLCGKRLWEMGEDLVGEFRRVSSLCSQSTAKGGFPDAFGTKDTFPLPTFRTQITLALDAVEPWVIAWVQAICMGLNSLWGCPTASLQDGQSSLVHEMVSEVHTRILRSIARDVARLGGVGEVTEFFEWDSFFRTRTIDYKGDEVKTAQQFTWRNIQPAIPREIGVVELKDICEQGCKHYIEHFPSFLKPSHEWGHTRKAKVMVADRDWTEVATGLLEAGIFGVIPESEVFKVHGRPLLNGLFGVEKHEEVDGIPVYRLIMNLVPLNALCQGLHGDITTLPHWFGMTPFHIQPHESMVVSSEDLRCFFYTLRLPSCWYPYVCFNKRLPSELVPPELRGQPCYPCSKVLPMGFLNSVGIAQHVHRVLARRSQVHNQVRDTVSQEIRKDRVLPEGATVWRVYLDNYDLLEKYPHEVLGGMVEEVAPEVLALRQEYQAWGLPRHPGKAVSRKTVAEVQGAVVDGERGIAYPKGQKLSKYVTIAYQLVSESHCSQRQMQVVCGGLVYFSTFRRQLLGGLNLCWAFIESFNSCGRHKQLIPIGVKLEITRFLCLVPLCRMDFRLKMNPRVTCSEASQHGGGVCVATSLTNYGEKVALGEERREMVAGSGPRILSIGLFDGIGCLRVALDLLGCDVIGHICVEKDAGARRVVEHHFPDSWHYDDVAEISTEDVQRWALRFGQASLILIGAGPPCQGVSGPNSQRKGALRDERSSLFVHVKRLRDLVQCCFPWGQVHCLMESVASMDDRDKDIMTKSFGDQPWNIDAGTFCWCSRPRLYWISWELNEQQEDVEIEGRRVILTGHQPWSSSVEAGWTKVDGDRPFPTFTTSRPRTSRGHRPAGLDACDKATITRWEDDLHRFPPYQYIPRNCVVNKRGEYRLPNIREREYMMGLPIGYTLMCMPKSKRKLPECMDKRLTLVGNAWAVPVVTWLIGQLVGPRGAGPLLPPAEILSRLTLEGNPYIQSRLLRAPLKTDQRASTGAEDALAQHLGRLVSTKGSDLMITAAQDEVQSYQRLRHTVNAKMWRWKVVSGWRWRTPGEHINSLELRAILACLRWRCEHLGEHGCRILHLTDSLVCLHSLSRGRTSSRRLRRTLCRINSLLLAHNLGALWGYVHTDLNPADKPSRWSVKTKFKHAKGRT